MCFAIGSQHVWCSGSQPKHVSSPACRSLTLILFLIVFFRELLLSTEPVLGDWTIECGAEGMNAATVKFKIDKYAQIPNCTIEPPFFKYDVAKIMI